MVDGKKSSDSEALFRIAVGVVNNLVWYFSLSEYEVGGQERGVLSA